MVSPKDIHDVVAAYIEGNPESVVITSGGRIAFNMSPAEKERLLQGSLLDQLEQAGELRYDNKKGVMR